MDIIKLAGLAKIRLLENQVSVYKTDLEFIANRIENSMQDVEIEQTVLSANDKMPLRKDVVQPSMKRDRLLAGAAEVESGCVVVPKLLEQ